MSFLLPIQLFKILADETRLGIVLLLSELGELCVCDLCTALDQSQPKISRHLALLRESGLLLDRKQGKWVHYRLSPHIPAWAAKIIDEAWRCEQEKVQAIFRIERGAEYGNSQNYYVQDGEQRYQGVELNGHLDVTDNTTLSSSSTWLDATFTKIGRAHV